MIKEIVDGILAAEAEADTIEKDAILKSREIGLKALNDTDEMKEEAERAITAEVKAVLARAQVQDIGTVDKAAGKGPKNSEVQGNDPAVVKAAQYIEKEFMKVLDK